MGKWEGFKMFLWNGDTRQILGRTGSSWAKILLFYISFYAVLAGSFAVMLAVFYQTLDENEPKWQLDNGLIGSNPGMAFRPMPPESNVESTLISFEAADEKNTDYWISSLDEFLEIYSFFDHETDRQRMDCDWGNNMNNNPNTNMNKVCRVSLEDFGPCTLSNKYGYRIGSPCVFLKLNRIYNWKPQFVNKTSQIFEKMPEDLKDIVGNKKDTDKTREMIWVSCEGQNPADIEHLGPVQYFPTRGFPGYFFPYLNQKAYMSPIVAIHFKRPRSKSLNRFETILLCNLTK